MNDFTAGVLAGVGTSAVAVLAWAGRSIVEHYLARRQKHEELLSAEVIRKRAEIARELFAFCRDLAADFNVDKLIASDLHVQVAIWFPDECYIAFRDMVGRLAHRAEPEAMSWFADAEPLLQVIVRALRNESRILDKPGVSVHGAEYHFLPHLVPPPPGQAEQLPGE